jgi:hypothetical protein
LLPNVGHGSSISAAIIDQEPLIMVNAKAAMIKNTTR